MCWLFLRVMLRTKNIPRKQGQHGLLTRVYARLLPTTSSARVSPALMVAAGAGYESIQWAQHVGIQQLE